MKPLLIDEPGKRGLIDEFGALEAEVARFAHKTKRHKELAETIRGWYSTHPADQPAVAEGKTYSVLVSPRGEERSLSPKSKARIFRMLGTAKAWELFTITLKSVETHLGETILARFAELKNTGYRKLTVVAKVAVNAVKAA